MTEKLQREFDNILQIESEAKLMTELPKFLEKHPEFKKYLELWVKAFQASQNFNFIEAKNYYEQLLKDLPNLSTAHNNFANLLGNDYFRDYENAKLHYEKSLEIKPNYAEAHNNLAVLLKNDYFRDYENAKLHYLKSLEIKPDYAEARNNFALLLANDYFRDYENAKIHYLESLRIKPDFAEAHNNFALLLKNDYFRDYENAKIHYLESLRIKPDFAEANYNFALLLGNDYFRDYENAKLHYQNALKNPKEKEILAVIHNNLATLLKNDYFRDYENAKLHYEKSLEIKPNYANAYNNLAVFYFEIFQNVEKAAEYCLKAIEFDKKEEVFRENLAELAETKPRPFISSIFIQKVRHIENLEIEISENEPKHLLLTGKNGSGKTSVLSECKNYLNKILEMSTEVLFSDKVEDFLNPKDFLLKFIIKPSLVDIHIKYKCKKFVCAYFSARRELNHKAIDHLEKVEFNEISINQRLNDKLIEYLTYLELQRLSAKEENEENKGTVESKELERNIKRFFAKFKEMLMEMDSRVKDIKIDTRTLNVVFKPESPFEVFDFSQLADGYSSIFDIVTEILLRMRRLDVFDLDGVVFIDEPEAHLHIEMQKKILPFLAKTFPRVQFIVATHSPFILTSLENAVVFDMENKQRLEKAANFSASSLIKHHLEVKSEQSEIVNQKISELEKLTTKALKEEISDTEERELAQLDMYLTEISQTLTADNFFRLKEIHKQLNGE